MAGPKRSIFEEVGEGAAPAAPRPGGIARRSGARRGLQIWMILLLLLVVLMVVVGGLTRLTGSGLSITEWRPVTGALPPLSEADWLAEFERYRQIPQYELVNRGMSLAEFQVIYWWEWGHRQLGRLVGLVWALGFLGFLAFRRFPPGWTGRALLLGVLGGAQGAIGWWMVSSGLAEGMIAVASYRLAIHLGLAFLIIGLLAWYILLLGRPETDLLQARRTREGRLFSVTGMLMYLAFLQILLGALVAGIDAGRGYTDWPLMNGVFFPPEALSLEPLWRNFFEHPAMTQFVHRMGGYVLLALGAVAWVMGRRSVHRATRAAFDVMALALVAQVGLGIATVLEAAPWYLASAHQLVAVILFLAILNARFLSQYPIAQSIRSRR